jgi:plasmid stabilization system protein ParE
VKWTAKQEQDFNEILDQLQGKNPEVTAIEIY